MGENDEDDEPLIGERERERELGKTREKELSLSSSAEVITFINIEGTPIGPWLVSGLREKRQQNEVEVVLSFARKVVRMSDAICSLLLSIFISQHSSYLTVHPFIMTTR